MKIFFNKYSLPLSLILFLMAAVGLFIAVLNQTMVFSIILISLFLFFFSLEFLFLGLLLLIKRKSPMALIGKIVLLLIMIVLFIAALLAFLGFVIININTLI